MRDTKDTENRRPLPDAEADGIIEGRNAVIEALRAGRPWIRSIWPRARRTRRWATSPPRPGPRASWWWRPTGASWTACPAPTPIRASSRWPRVREYVSVESMLDAAADKGEQPLLVVCDEISDPHNLGAILRTAECAGAHGVIIPKRRSAGLTAIVGQDLRRGGELYAGGAGAEYPGAAEGSEKAGRLGVRHGGGGHDPLYQADLKGPAAIVIGSEGDGMTPPWRENCDFLVSIPMKGKISSLNASAAAAILLYEAVRQRG